MKRMVLAGLLALFLCIGGARAADSFTPLRDSPAYKAITAQTDAILEAASVLADGAGAETAPAAADIDFDRAYRVYLGKVFLECTDLARLAEDLETAEYLWHIPVQIGTKEGIMEFCRDSAKETWELQSFFLESPEKSHPAAYADAVEKYTLDPDAPVYFIYGENGFYIRSAVTLSKDGEPLAVPLTGIPSYYLDDLPGYSGEGPLPFSDFVRLYQKHIDGQQAYTHEIRLRLLAAALFALAAFGVFIARTIHKAKKSGV